MHEFFRLKKWLIYQWRAKTKYYLHSPFVYSFYLNVLEGEPDENIRGIEQLRRQLKQDNTPVETGNFGTGRHTFKTIAELEGMVAIRPKYGWVLYRLVKKFNPQNMLELGGSIGLSSAYLAAANASSKAISVEGSAGLVELARSNYAKLAIDNIQTVTGNFDDCLPGVLAGMDSVDLVFFDGNHTQQATLKYFEQCLAKARPNSVFVFDDIYWSPDMYEAWKIIKSHPQIKLTIDIFQLGICFFITSKLAKEDFILRY
jgi:predicted O-methyltransferase YrrM